MNEIIDENEKENKESSFDKLKKIQKLIKKESALKEICKQNM
jgi:hypothetical protein